MQVVDFVEIYVAIEATFGKVVKNIDNLSCFTEYLVGRGVRVGRLGVAPGGI
jgi:hypothetical protein